MSARTYTIYLIAPRVTNVDAIVKPGNDHYSVRVQGRMIGDLYVKPVQPEPPSWVELFANTGIDLTAVRAMTSSAVMLVHTGGRRFAITFGTGRSMLQPDATEERFGLKVTLNAVDPARIRSVERLTIDSPAPHSQIQARTGVDIREFGLDVDQDLLREVAGPPRDPQALGLRLTGKDALHATADFTLEQLPARLRRYLAESKKTDYRDRFPWVDHIREIKSATRRDDLDTVLTDRLQKQQLGDIWLAVPEIINWDLVDAFTYRDTPTADRHAEIDVAAFLNTLRDPTTVTVAALKRYRISAVTQDGNAPHQWSAYHCIYAEITLGTKQYVLNNGTWFEVEPSFRERIEKAFAAIPRRTRRLPNANKNEIERDYNERVARDNATYALMDRKNIPFPNAQNTIEFCDLYTNKREMIHVKPYTGSSTLSHLFAQGVTSGRLFKGDATFRKAVNNKLPTAYRLATPDDTLPAQAFTVTYAIIKEGPAPLNLPFFSKVSLNNAMTTLRALGYNVQIAKVDVKP
ncbi:MAG: uncharacterized protein JWN34_2237 [Bryobacterales bacterium]|nr:uncharacterized protein [Bryobacterales bacterium]